MLHMLNFVIMMLNGLLGVAIAKVLEVAACLFWSDSNAPEGDFLTSLSFPLIFSLCSLFLMYGSALIDWLILIMLTHLTKMPLLAYVFRV